jgi:hypothetical protein
VGGVARGARRGRATTSRSNGARTGDPPGFRLDDCATQRNLSEAGREQARQIGVAFRAEHVPVREVLSSQYCGCLDTAELLGLGPVTAAPMLNSFFGNRSTADGRPRSCVRRSWPTAGGTGW